MNLDSYYESMKRIKAAQVSAMELSTPFFCGVVGFFDFRRNSYSYADCRYGFVICRSLFLIQKRRGVFLNVLAEIVAIWPELPGHIKQAIKSLLKTDMDANRDK